MKIVLDASMSLAWLFLRDSEEERLRAEQALNAIEYARIEVPQLWLLEIGNALLVGERRNLITGSRSIDFLARLRKLPIIVDAANISERMPFILQYAREFSLSSYDATYLDLARRSGAQLATFDKKLAAATRQAGGEVFTGLS